MLRIPPSFMSSRDIDLCIFNDWVQGSILLTDDELSISDIVDFLCEELVFDSQSDARKIVEDSWEELQRQADLLGSGCPYTIDDDWLVRTYEWDESLAYSFCVLVCYGSYFSKWRKNYFPTESNYYNKQGLLFELLTKESLEVQFPDWSIYYTGWSDQSTTNFKKIVETICEELSEPMGQFKLWNDPDVKDKGLDILWYRPFPDQRVGIPVYLVQCASGKKWKGKRKEPDIKIWSDVVSFRAIPKRAIAIPYTLSDRIFLQSCRIVDGMVLDRNRLLAASINNRNWLSDSLRNDIKTWLSNKVTKIQQLAS